MGDLRRCRHGYSRRYNLIWVRLASPLSPPLIRYSTSLIRALAGGRELSFPYQIAISQCSAMTTRFGDVFNVDVLATETLEHDLQDGTCKFHQWRFAVYLKTGGLPVTTVYGQRILDPGWCQCWKHSRPANLFPEKRLSLSRRRSVQTILRSLNCCHPRSSAQACFQRLIKAERAGHTRRSLA
jgi:hypothetical protein